MALDKSISVIPAFPHQNRGEHRIGLREPHSKLVSCVHPHSDTWTDILAHKLRTIK